ncbi:MAG: NADH:ubiquinone reductase (Na(+)-transporting) subunit B [Bacteroidales bacterium]|nr:NADH:ubiquinone reductase (Na(+)-transporting) subunit B [Bacteroidales bacterium]
MKALRNYLDSVKPNFEKGGKYEKLHSTFEAFESFLFAPATTNTGGVHVRDGVDLKRVISMVILALIPATIFGIWNAGFQYYNVIGQADSATVVDCFLHGLYIFLPMVVVSYVVGLGIEFATAQIRNEQVNEGFLATGLLIPLVLPAGVPLWMVGVATAFSVIFAKEVFGGTGMNIWNPALIARAVLFFAYPSKMSGEAVWYYGDAVDGHTGATALAQAVEKVEPVSFIDAFIGIMPGSIGETSALCILIGGLFLLLTGVASWKVMLSVFVGGAVTALCFNQFGPDTPIAQLPWYDHLVYGGFAFGAVFMATDPVTSSRTECGKYIYGLLIGFVAIVVRVLNPGYPEGMMLAILFMNTMAPLIDYIIVESNVSRRKKRAIAK